MHCFISDVHIRTDENYRAKLLIKFLHDMRPKITDLYILGDLFEFWFEYNLVFPKYYFKTLAALYNLIQDGRRVHYVLGNHEVMTGNFLKGFGFIVHPGGATIKIGGRRIFIAHGNMVDKRIWITLWQKILTSKLNHALYSIIHPDLGIFLAQGISYLSRRQHNSPGLIKGLENFARTKFEEVDVVILAHSHIPVIKYFQNGKCYINTGDWINNFSYAIIDRHRISLEYYKPR
jgi:UDP-2,3-diacylglucosamine hydrolase